MEAGNRHTMKLSDLQEEIREVIQSSFETPRWIICEIMDITQNYSGHCYLDLIEKDEKSDKILARARATIWASSYRMLKPYFETSTGYELASGIKILVLARVEFHPVYGLSLNIQDIDPSYTLGDVERKKREIILRLENEGVLDMNKEIPLPIVPQRIAVVSSISAAGYEDFMDQLRGNPYGYQFYTRLFPAVMQGENAAQSIIESLERIFEYESHFDAVVIIRGGGSKSDLACFDSYDLAYHVSQFPLPVITGIGHEQDDTITDLVAHTRLKTPTAVAGFFIDKLASFEGELEEFQAVLINATLTILNEQKLRLQLYQQKYVSGSIAMVHTRQEYLLKLTGDARFQIQQQLRFYDQLILRFMEQLRSTAKYIPQRIAIESLHVMQRFKQLINNKMEGEAKRLEEYRRLVAYAEPGQILKIGFSISRLDGKALKDVKNTSPGSIVETELYSGKFKSKVIDIQKKNIL
jgi:exodeoxyribonuclease VII large subunit